MVGDAHAATAGTAIDVKRRSEHMENEDSLKIERLEDDGLQDVSGGAGDSYTYRQASSKKDGRNRKGELLWRLPSKR